MSDDNKICATCAFFVQEVSAREFGECYLEPPTWNRYRLIDGGYVRELVRPKVQVEEFCSHWAPRKWHGNEG